MDDEPVLTITTSDDGLALDGDVDGRTAEQFEAALEGLVQGTNEARVDMSAVAFMDSSGLRVLLELTDRARTDGGDLVIVRPSGTVQRLFTLSGLDDHFTIAN